MLHETNEEKKLSIENTGIKFESLNEDYELSEEIYLGLLNSNLVLLPTKERSEAKKFFPEQTINFFEFLKSNEKKYEIVVDIASNDQDYKELELHSNIVHISEILVKGPLFDIAVSLIASYLYDFLKSRNKKPSEINTHVTINVEVGEKEKTQKINFEGSIENFERTMKALDIKKNSEE